MNNLEERSCSKFDFPNARLFFSELIQAEKGSQMHPISLEELSRTVDRLVGDLAGTKQRIDISNQLIQALFERSLVAEALLGVLVSSQEIDLDAVEKLMLEERGGTEKKSKQISELIDGLRKRSKAPWEPLKD
ncbi:hypothetical protein [Novosphingobium decolorationis]|uniref:Uncharacterized protein n=1 Tax=Novosphingobium decolorationis TaxID=2698673 RepID=A0ABX8E4I8_9SPHN|nr:hypothetical protein [Novosphingobium decolorationis]MED5545662.1 hypothetical protein [Pseudomonadota bacterium]QVM82971.1 hypothetical protein HT578_03920 [Novosphingobium decolorationis]